MSCDAPALPACPAVPSALAAIRAEHGVHIPLAVESGSRARGEAAALYRATVERLDAETTGR